jgi:hypothetical protein
MIAENYSRIFAEIKKDNIRITFFHDSLGTFGSQIVPNLYLFVRVAEGAPDFYQQFTRISGLKNNLF